MEIIQLPKDPASLSENGYEAIWVELKEREAPSPLAGRTLQWLDWKLQGQISRWLVGQKGASESPLFVPTMRKLPTQYVVLVNKAEAKRVKDSCDGLGLRKVLLICEDASRAAAVGKEVQGKGGKWPASLDLGLESGEGTA